MLDKSSQFLSSEQPCEPKSLDVASNIAGVEKLRSENLRLRSTWRPFDSSLYNYPSYYIISDKARCFSQSERALHGNFIIISCITHTARARLKLFDRLAEAFRETLSNNNTVSSQRSIHVVEF